MISSSCSLAELLWFVFSLSDSISLSRSSRIFSNFIFNSWNSSRQCSFCCSRAPICSALSTIWTNERTNSIRTFRLGCKEKLVSFHCRSKFLRLSAFLASSCFFASDELRRSSFDCRQRIDRSRNEIKQKIRDSNLIRTSRQTCCSRLDSFLSEARIHSSVVVRWTGSESSSYSKQSLSL